MSRLERLINRIAPPPSREQALDPSVRARALGQFRDAYRPGVPAARLTTSPPVVDFDVLVVGGASGAFASFVPDVEPATDPMHGCALVRFVLGQADVHTIQFMFHLLGPDPFEGPHGTEVLAVQLGSAPAVVYTEGDVPVPDDVQACIIEYTRGRLFAYRAHGFLRRAGRRAVEISPELPPHQAVRPVARHLITWIADGRNLRRVG